MLARYCDSIVKVLRAGRKGEGVGKFLAKFFRLRSISSDDSIR